MSVKVYFDIAQLYTARWCDDLFKSLYLYCMWHTSSLYYMFLHAKAKTKFIWKVLHVYYLALTFG
jgi:hypothetical protein